MIFRRRPVWPVQLALPVLLLFMALNAQAHGPGRRIQVESALCGPNMKQEGKSAFWRTLPPNTKPELCIDIHNREDHEVSIALWLLRGLVDETGTTLCQESRNPQESTRFNKNDAPVFKFTLPPGVSAHHQLPLLLPPLQDYPADKEGHDAFHGWLGCLQLRATPAGDHADGLKGTRSMHILRARSR